MEFGLINPIALIRTGAAEGVMSLQAIGPGVWAPELPPGAGLRFPLELVPMAPNDAHASG
jgi:hypothetical protein